MSHFCPSFIQNNFLLTLILLLATSKAELPVLQELAPTKLFKHFSVFPVMSSTTYSSTFHNPHNSRYLKHDLPFKLNLQFSVKSFFTKLGPNLSQTFYVFLKFMNVPLFWNEALRFCTVGKHLIILLRKPQNTLLQERLRC